MTPTTISVQRRLNEHVQKLNALQTSKEENETEIHGIKEENKPFKSKIKSKRCGDEKSGKFQNKNETNNYKNNKGLFHTKIKMKEIREL